MRTRLALLFALAAAGHAQADDFDRLEGKALDSLLASGEAQPRDRLTLEQISDAPRALRGVRSLVALAKTDEGNVARLQLASGFVTAGPEAMVPIIIVERFATFESGALTKRIARGRDLRLYPGQQLDLDSGQVVPDAFGGDLVATGSGPSIELLPAQGVSLHILAKPPIFPDAEPGTPSPGRVVIPTDYAGRYFLYADGSTSGRLDLTVSDHSVTGKFRSEETGSTFPVKGEITTDPVPRLRFTIQFPRSTDEYEGVLFTDGKGAIAGSVIQLDRTHSFFALREAGRIAPDGADPAP